MHVAYLSIDEVNQAAAQEIAEALDVTLFIRTPRDKPPGKEFDGVLCDWDSWPSSGRAEFVAMSARESIASRVAAHGYNISEEESESLIYSGVLVWRVLEAEVFRRLIQATPQVVRLAYQTEEKAL